MVVFAGKEAYANLNTGVFDRSGFSCSPGNPGSIAVS